MSSSQIFSGSELDASADTHGNAEHRSGDSVRQVGVISGVGPGRHDQAALGVICSVISSSIIVGFSSAMASTCM